MKKQGISLIILVITIIVIIILAGAVILSLANNNPIDTAKDAVLKQGVADAMEQLALAKVMAQRPGATLDYSAVQEIINKGNLPIKIVDGKLELDSDKELGEREKVIIEEILGITSGGGSTEPSVYEILAATTLYTDANSDIAYIPKGFKILEEFNVIDDGLVIADENGNEFVWVPVPEFNDKFKRTKTFNGTIAAPTPEANYTEPIGNTENPLTEVDKMYKSVKDYGGFYIGRYQTAYLEDEEDGSRTPIVKPGYEVWNYIKWGEANNNNTPGDGAVTEARRLYPDTALYSDLGANTSGVVSTLAYGVQWDAALQFISITYSTYATNSVALGRYSSSSPILTGSNPGYSKNNIFDMAGNVWEWTMETFLTGRCYRGGAYYCSGSGIPAGARSGGGIGDTEDSNGFRIALYIK